MLSIKHDRDIFGCKALNFKYKKKVQNQLEKNLNCGILTEGLILKE